MKEKANIICLEHNDSKRNNMNLRDIFFCMMVFIFIYVLAISCCPKAFSIDSLEYHIGTTKIGYPSTWQALNSASRTLEPSNPKYWDVEFSPINNLDSPTQVFFKVVPGNFGNIVLNDLKANFVPIPATWQNFKFSVSKNEPDSISIKYSYAVCQTHVVIINNVPQERCQLGQPSYPRLAYKSYEYLPTGSVLISLYISSSSGYLEFWNDFASFQKTYSLGGSPIGTNPCPNGTATHSPQCGPWCATQVQLANLRVEHKPPTERTFHPECNMSW